MEIDEDNVFVEKRKTFIIFRLFFFVCIAFTISYYKYTNILNFALNSIDTIFIVTVLCVFLSMVSCGIQEIEIKSRSKKIFVLIFLEIILDVIVVFIMFSLFRGGSGNQDSIDYISGLSAGYEEGYEIGVEKGKEEALAEYNSILKENYISFDEAYLYDTDAYLLGIIDGYKARSIHLPEPEYKEEDLNVLDADCLRDYYPWN